MISYLLFIIILGIVIYIGILFESAGMIMLGMSGALFLVLSFIYLLWAKRRITASITVPIMLVEKGRAAKVNVEIFNGMKLSSGRLAVKIKYGTKGLKKGRGRLINIEKAKPGKSLCQQTITLKRAGSYDFLVKSIRIYDMTGLLYLSKRINISDTAIVLPELDTVSVRIGEGVRNFFGDADSFDDLKSGYDPSETFDIREYRAGDRLQSVHWKLSAKTDDLIVKESSLPKACAIVLVLDPDRGNPETLESFYRWGAAISLTLMEEKCAHYVAWKSEKNQEVIRARVDDEESFYLFLTSFMPDAVAGVGEGYEEKYRRDIYLHKLVLYGDGSLEIDKESRGKPDFDNYEIVL